MKTSLKNAELVNTVIRKMMTIMFIAGKEMKNVNINHAKKNTASGKNGFGQKQNRRIICQE